MRKNMFKAPAKKVNKPKVEVKKPVENKKPVETVKPKKYFGGRSIDELSPIEQRMVKLYGDRYKSKKK